MEEQKKAAHPEEQISDETLEQVSGGNKLDAESAEGAKDDDASEETAGAKGHFFKYKKKKKFFHHHLHDD